MPGSLLRVFAVAGPLFLALGLCLTARPAVAQDGDSDLATQLANPLATLISVPIQGDADWNIGPLEDGSKVFANVQPVVPVTLNEDWNLISRTILPITYQHAIFPGAGRQFGLGDITQSLFFSPSRVSNPPETCTGSWTDWRCCESSGGETLCAVY